jgi:hypothetical protein
MDEIGTEAQSLGRSTNRVEYEVVLYRSNTLPEWLAQKMLVQSAKQFNFLDKFRLVDDHAIVRSWTWDVSCVKNSLETLVQNETIARYTIKVETAKTVFGGDKLSDYF